MATMQGSKQCEPYKCSLKIIVCVHFFFTNEVVSVQFLENCSYEVCIRVHIAHAQYTVCRVAKLVVLNEISNLLKTYLISTLLHSFTRFIQYSITRLLNYKNFLLNQNHSSVIGVTDAIRNSTK